MKLHLPFIMLLFLSSVSFGQKTEFSLSTGTGKTYIFESLDRSVHVKYGLPLSLMSELKFTPKGKSWGLKVRVNYLSSTITGQNWLDNLPLDGYINSVTTSLLLENEIKKNRSSYGFNFGLGMTSELLEPMPNIMFSRLISYPSLTFGGHISYKLSRDFDFQVLPSLLWQDPFKTMAVLTGHRRANLAGEDLSAVVNFGVRCHLN